MPGGVANLSQWDDGRRGQDGWGRYTRRRKWYRDAELVELTAGVATNDGSADALEPSTPATEENITTIKDSDSANSSQARRRGLFRRSRRTSTPGSSDLSGASGLRGADDEDEHLLPPSQQHGEGDWEIGDDMKMGMG